MAKKLIIVESPTKVHTISKLLNSSYKVVASQGHVRDLPKSRLGVDVENDFEPKYITIRGKGELLSSLKSEVKKADKIYLATDPDREGEAISWHLLSVLPVEGKKVYRIAFNEITEKAVKEALNHPREIDRQLVDAQQARRILDRVVGYKISPVLWAKVKSKLSAGRVQSAVLSMICQREKEISAFEPEEYWSIEASLLKDKKEIKSEFYGKNGKKESLTSKEEVDLVLSESKANPFVVSELKKGSRVKNAPFPFTTSTLQQEASTKLNFSTSKTMRLSQELYEGVKVKNRGLVGLITYLRTDSTRISEEADAACKEFVKGTYGEEFVGAGAVSNKKGKIQDAHEAIRPTFVDLTPESVKADLSRDLLRLYTLIWKRFVASRMKACVYDTVSAKIAAGQCTFGAASSRVAFAGFSKVYDNSEEKKSENKALFDMEEGEELTLSNIEGEQHFTAPPPHYTEATLVRAMEEKGLGRPSTYAPTIGNILGKHYITKEGRTVYVTELGEVVNGLMQKSFPEIVDLNFTAEMESKLDKVETGEKEWKSIMREFYPDFEKEIQDAEKNLEKIKIQDEVTDEVCEKCGKPMVVKYGRNGKFMACSGFPECRNTKSIVEKTNAKCPKCGGEIIVCRSKKGRRFYACENRECDYMSWNKPKTPDKE